MSVTRELAVNVSFSACFVEKQVCYLRCCLPINEGRTCWPVCPDIRREWGRENGYLLLYFPSQAIFFCDEGLVLMTSAAIQFLWYLVCP